jgi:D-alanyl-D-alanine carboxypeptidase/D-alanyl-D-alanine-endopeptidase (penicillin-binding protein 4)
VSSVEGHAVSRRRRQALHAPGVLLLTIGLLTGCEATSAPLPPPQRLDPPPVGAGAVLAPALGDPRDTLPVARLTRLLRSGPLGPDPSALVVSAEDGSVLLDVAGSVPRTPASLLKLTTAAAALSALDPASRLRTRVVRGASAEEVVLVGAGDTTLTAHPDRARRRHRAGLAALAAATTRALKAAGVASVRVGVDDSLFTGAAVSPHWPGSYVAAGVVSPVSSLSLDGGRVSPRSDVREQEPAIAAGNVFARMLRRAGLDVPGDVVRSVAPAAARELAAVESPTVADLVELMLSSSDNDLAESLLRLAALARGRAGTFDVGTTVVRAVLDELGVPSEQVRALDGSGLARGSKLAPATLTGLLVTAAAETGSPTLDHLLTGLPVAGFSGTLASRFGAGRARSAAGVVRAKTGTLTGVSTLAGTATVAGAAVIFVVMSDRVPGDTLAARRTLDRFAAVLGRRAHAGDVTGR